MYINKWTDAQEGKLNGNRDLTAASRVPATHRHGRVVHIPGQTGTKKQVHLNLISLPFNNTFYTNFRPNFSK